MPTDHQSAAVAEARSEPLSITVQGIDLQVVPAVIAGDYQVLRAIKRMQAGTADVMEAVTLIESVLGDQHDAVVNQLREPDGTVPMERVVEFVSEVFEAITPGN